MPEEARSCIEQASKKINNLVGSVVWYGLEDPPPSLHMIHGT